MVSRQGGAGTKMVERMMFSTQVGGLKNREKKFSTQGTKIAYLPQFWPNLGANWRKREKRREI